jgi:hypothetical protein
LVNLSISPHKVTGEYGLLLPTSTELYV